MDLNTLKSDESALRKALEIAGAHIRGRALCCPMCKEKHASGSIHMTNEGHWVFTCHSSCDKTFDVIDIRAWINKKTPAEELRAMNDTTAIRQTPKPPPIYPTYAAAKDAIAKSSASDFAAWEDDYLDLYAPLEGESGYSVVRFRKQDGDKSFRQMSRTAGGWWLKVPDAGRPIANRKGIAAADMVVCCEGEKATKALLSVGICATTSPQGALNGDKADWSPLKGKQVVLWPDNDTPLEKYPRGLGWEHMRRVRECVASIAEEISVLDPRDLELPEKGDAWDFVERYRKGYNAAEIKALVMDVLADATSLSVKAEYRRELEAIIAGKRRAIAFPWPQLTEFSRALLPGKVTCLCGDGGGGKSFFVSDAIVQWQWFHKVAIFHLEDTRNDHLQRVHAQLAGDGRITDNSFVEQNAAYIMESYHIHEKEIDIIGRNMWTRPDEGDITLDDVAAWVMERAKDGFEIVIVDPITAVGQTGRPWVEDLKFITAAKIAARRYGCRVILVTHPRTGTKKGVGNHNDMAGGAAYPRFSHCVLWLEGNAEENEFKVRDRNGLCEFIRPNRVVTVSKARHGPGTGRRLAFQFDGKTLRYNELGAIERE
jgi:hypothetical protein